MPGRSGSVQKVSHTNGSRRWISQSCRGEINEKCFIIFYIRVSSFSSEFNERYLMNFIFSFQNVGIDKGDIPDLTKVRYRTFEFTINRILYKKKNLMKLFYSSGSEQLVGRSGAASRVPGRKEGFCSEHADSIGEVCYRKTVIRNPRD